MKNLADLPSEIRGQLRLLPGEVVAYRADHLLTLAWLAVASFPGLSREGRERPGDYCVRMREIFRLFYV